MKEIVLDTETTGISVKDGHRIVEIGCIELDNLIPTLNKPCKYAGVKSSGLASKVISASGFNWKIDFNKFKIVFISFVFKTEGVPPPK